MPHVCVNKKAKRTNQNKKRINYTKKQVAASAASAAEDADDAEEADAARLRNGNGNQNKRWTR